MSKPCANPECSTTIGDDREFCSTCEWIIQDRAHKLDQDVGHLLHLSADFVEWCESHGHPHPYT